MSEPKAPLGSIGWVDLTVPDAENVRDFYKAVVGWESGSVDMGEYQDFTMMPAGTESAVAGVCHARGGNADIPAAWMIYITVPDVAAAAKKCVEMGGEVLVGPKGEQAIFCVIKDPAGAVCGLFQAS